MINFDFITLKLFLEENNSFFVGARLQKIQQPTRQELIFTMRGQGETRKFYININPNFFHACFMSLENEKKRALEIPKSPPMFCMLLRKYLESAKVAKIVQPEGERILELYFETYNEIGEKIYLCLAIELMGKHSNVILYNYDTNMILGCMHNIGAEKSSVREIIGGLPYAYPPKKNNCIFNGLSTLINENQNINSFIDNYFAPIQEQEKIRQLKSKLLTNIKYKLKKTTTALEKIKKQTPTEEKADFYRKKGDLIMSNLYNLKDFSKIIEVMDYEKNKTVEIELDETKTLKENANQFYKLYNKAKNSNLKAEEMNALLEKEKEYLEQLLYSIQEADSLELLREIEDEIFTTTLKPKENKKPKQLPILNIKIDDFNIFIGKSNKQNDYIVSKLAREDDLWFHTHICAGSHVLLRIESGQIPNDKIIFECAKLAKEYSSAKNSSKVGVIYTKAKNLRKPPAAALGYVTYKGEKEIIID